MLPFTRTYLLLFTLLFAFAPALRAQNELSKEEIKAWKEKAQDYRRNLPALKQLVEEHESYQNQVVSLQQQLVEAQNQAAMKDRQITALESQQADMNQRIIDAEAKARENKQPAASSQPVYTSTAPMLSGVVFRVQIGAFKVNKMDADLATGNNMLLNEAADGFQKVQVGEFRSYASARRLRDQLRKTGIRDAFVVATQDGQPIDAKIAAQSIGESVED